MKRRHPLFPVGVLAVVAKRSTSFGWSPPLLFRRPLTMSRLVSPPTKRRLQTSRLWVAQQHSNIPTNNNTTMQVTSTSLEYDLLQEENGLLRETIRQLELENERLKNSASRIVIENFEGEGKLPPESSWFEGMGSSGPPELPSAGGITLTGEQLEAQQQLWCDELDGDECPIEPTISFGMY